MIKENRIPVVALICLFSIFVGIYTLPFPFLMEANVNQLAYLSAAFLPLLASFYALKFYGVNNNQGKVFIFMSIAFLLLFLGELTWTIFLFKKIDPFPSMADYFYILFYPFLFFALLKQLKISQVDWKIKNIFNKFTLLTLAAILIFLVAYFAVYSVYDSQLDLFQNTIAVAYGIADMVLIFLAFFVFKVAYEFKGGRLFYGWLTFALALFATLLADIGFACFYGCL